MVKGLVINDLHFGIRESKRMYDELKIFIDKINEVKPDIIIFDGDYFDHKISVGDPAAYYGISFFDEVMELAKKYNTQVRMVQGTRSHDLNQLQIFKPYELKPEYNFRIYETVTKDDVCGMHLLFIPEEYPENANEYYKYYRDDEYNAIFGHGSWDFVSMESMIEISNKETHSAPVFMWADWKHCVKNGFISFGHIHGRNTYKKKIFYSGSFTRWNYGERSAKGFTYFEYDLETLKYNVKYIDNTLAPKYEVMSVKELNMDLENTDAGTIQMEIGKLLSENMNLRINLSGLSKDKIKVLREYYSDIDNVKIEIKEEKKELLKTSADSEEFKKWHYITRRELPIAETIQKFAKEELSKELSLDVIKTLIEMEA